MLKKFLQQLKFKNYDPLKMAKRQQNDTKF